MMEPGCGGKTDQLGASVTRIGSGADIAQARQHEGAVLRVGIQPAAFMEDQDSGALPCA